MDVFAFIHAPDPTKVRVIDREREVDKQRLLDTTVGSTVPLLPVAPDRLDSELEASVKRLFDEAPVRLRRQRNRKSVAVDARGASHPPKKLREDHGTLRGTFVAESVSTTSEREDADHMDSVVEPNLRTIEAPQRFVISSESSHHSGPTIAEAEVDSLVRLSTLVMTTATTVTSLVDSTLVAKERTVKPSLFSVDSSSAGGSDPNIGVFSDLSSSDFLSVTNGSRLDDSRVCREMVDEFARPKFFAFIHGMEHDQLFIVFNVGATRQMSLSVEDELLKANDGEIENIKAQLLLKEAEATEAICLRRNVILKKERDALDVKVTDLEVLVVGKKHDVTDLNAQLTSVKSQNDSLADQVHKLKVSSAELQEKITVYDNYMEQLEKFQDDRMKIVNDKLAKLDSDLAEMACHLEEKIYPRLLNTISGQRWLLTHGLKLFLVKCLNSSEYLTALGAAISRAIEKEMQSGLAAGIDHEFREVDLSLLAELKSYKGASTKDIMNVLCLEGALVDAPRMNDLQPDIEQLKVPIHRSEDQVTPLSEPLFVTSLMGTEGTSNAMPTTADTTTTLSITLASASIIAPISVDDYEVMGMDDQAGADENAKPFPNVDDAELNIPQ
nr:hypothetical protein [Tanacetum cinerariifolium]